MTLGGVGGGGEQVRSSSQNYFSTGVTPKLFHNCSVYDVFHAFYNLTQWALVLLLTVILCPIRTK